LAVPWSTQKPEAQSQSAEHWPPTATVPCAAQQLLVEREQVWEAQKQLEMQAPPPGMSLAGHTFSTHWPSQQLLLVYWLPSEQAQVTEGQEAPPEEPQATPLDTQ
jgi:hypothetical protein